jgi:hypothetical protein
MAAEMKRAFEVLFGLCSLGGLIIALMTVVQATNAYRDALVAIDKTEVVNAEALLGAIKNLLDGAYSSLLTLIWSIVVLLIAVLCYVAVANIMHGRLAAQLHLLPEKNSQLEGTVKKLMRQHRVLTQNTHNILQYQRNTIVTLDDALGDAASADTLTGAVHRGSIDFTSFLHSFLASVAACFRELTGSNCSCCMKIIRDGRVKTLYRDSLSYRERKASDIRPNGRPFIYELSDNEAFARIIDRAITDRTFVCDDLANMKDYRNFNQRWRRLYNACIVVPISTAGAEAGEWNVYGFICVDNFVGGFAIKETEDFLAGLGDSIAPIFVRFNRLAELALEGGVDDEFVQKYNDWDRD